MICHITSGPTPTVVLARRPRKSLRSEVSNDWALSKWYDFLIQTAGNLKFLHELFGAVLTKTTVHM